MRRALRGRGLAGAVVLQLLLFLGYSTFRTQWHYLLHTALGFAAGLVVAAVVVAIRRRPCAPLASAVVGQMVSVTPDVMFRMLRMSHVRWMDVFVAHVTIHTSPGRLLVTAASAITASWAWWCAAVGRRRLGLTLAGLAVAMVGTALAFHTPVPTRLSDYYVRFYTNG